MARYRLTRKAAQDVRAIYRRGGELFGDRQAELYHRSLETTFELIADNPRLARLRDEIRPPVRVHPHGAHLIVYLVDKSGDVLIIRVYHGRENWRPS
jgi:toxin ParE1/3/4